MRKVVALLCLGFAVNATAQTDLTVRGSGKLFPIALPQLCVSTESSKAAKEIPEVLARSLDISGYFEVLNPNSFIENPGKCNAKEGFAYSDWSVIGAEGLVKGVVTQVGSKIKVQMYLHDVQRQRAVLGKEYEGDLSFAKPIAHKFANEIMKFFTGKYGVFGSQIVFSSRVGRFKELFMMDMDGTDIQQITQDRGLAVSAAWHPSANDILYTSYRNRVPDIFALNLYSKRLSQLSQGLALELGAEYSPDGKNILVSRTVDGESDIVLLNEDGTLARTLTKRNGAIDVSPSWSPDKKKVVFCSNRAGGPQIYTMNADGSSPQRISYVNSSYCTSPSWSPDGSKIAFVCRADRGFQIFAANPDGSRPLQLTSYGNNEDPAWSPDGRFLVFSSTFGRSYQFNLALMKSDGSSLKQLTFRKTDDTQPVWGPLPVELRDVG